MLRILGNILWHVPFMGFLSALAAFLLGLLLTVLVVTSPIGLGLIQYSKFLLLPFSYSMVSGSDLGDERNALWKTYSTIVMIVYLPLGILLSIILFFQIIGLCLTIVGIPVGIVLLKSLSTYLNPVNKKCVPVAVAYHVEAAKGQATVESYFNK